MQFGGKGASREGVIVLALKVELELLRAYSCWRSSPAGGDVHQKFYAHADGGRANWQLCADGERGPSLG